MEINNEWISSDKVPRANKSYVWWRKVAQCIVHIIVLNVFAEGTGGYEKHDFSRSMSIVPGMPLWELLARTRVYLPGLLFPHGGNAAVGTTRHTRHDFDSSLPGEGTDFEEDVMAKMRRAISTCASQIPTWIMN